VAVRGNNHQQQQQPRPKQTSSDRPEERASEQAATLTQVMSVCATGSNGPHWTLCSRVATIVRRIMREANDAASEEEKQVAITKIVIKLMDVNDH